MYDKQIRDMLDVVVIRGRRYVPAGSQQTVTVDDARRVIGPKADEINKMAARQDKEDEDFARAIAMIALGTLTSGG